MGNLDFDSEGVSDPTSFDVLPDNTDVLCVLAESEIVDNKKGDGRYLYLTFDSIDDAHPGRKFWERLNLWSDRSDDKAKKMITIATSQLAQLTRAVGKVKVADHEDLRAIPLILHLGVEPARGEWPAKNKVKEYRRADGTKVTAGPGAASGKPADKKNGSAAPWAR